MTFGRQTALRIGLVLACVGALAGGVAVANARQSHTPTRAAHSADVFTVVERATTDVIVYVNKKAQDDVIGNTLGFGNNLTTRRTTRR